MSDKIYVIRGNTGSIINENYEHWGVCCFSNKELANTYASLANARAKQICKLKEKYLPYNPMLHGVNEYDLKMEIEEHIWYYVEEIPILTKIEVGNNESDNRL